MLKVFSVFLHKDLDKLEQKQRETSRIITSWSVNGIYRNIKI